MAFSREINFEEVLKKISEQFLTQISLTCSALHLKDPEKGWQQVAFFHNESSLDPSQLYIECSTEELEKIALSKKPQTAPYVHKAEELDPSLQSNISSLFILSTPLMDFEDCQGILTFWAQPEAQFFEAGGGEEYLLLMADEALSSLKQRQRLVEHMHKFAEEEEMEIEGNTLAAATEEITDPVDVTSDITSEIASDESAEAISEEYQSTFLSTDLADRISMVEDDEDFTESLAHTIDFSSDEEEIDSPKEILNGPDLSAAQEIPADQLAHSDLFDVDDETAVESELVQEEIIEQNETVEEAAPVLKAESIAEEEIAEDSFGNLWEEGEPEKPSEVEPAMEESFQSIQSMDVAPTEETPTEEELTEEALVEEMENVIQKAEELEELMVEADAELEEVISEASTTEQFDLEEQEAVEEEAVEEQTEEGSTVSITGAEEPLQETDELNKTSFLGFEAETTEPLAEEAEEAEEKEEVSFSQPEAEVSTPDPDLEEEIKLELEGELEADAEMVAEARVDLQEASLPTITEEEEEGRPETTEVAEYAVEEVAAVATMPIPASETEACLQIILQHSGQAFLAFDKDGNVAPLYGQIEHPYLGKLAAGDDALEPIFCSWNASNPDSASFQNERDLTLIRDLMQSVFMRITDLEVLTEMFPSQLEKNGTVLKLEYHYLESPQSMDQDRIFIVFKDITEEILLQQKIQAEASHSNMLIKVALDLEGYSNYHKEFHKAISIMLEELEKPVTEIDLALLMHLTINISSGAEIYEIAEINALTPNIELGINRHLSNGVAFKGSTRDMLAMSVLEMQELMDMTHQKYLESLVSAKKLKDLDVFQVSGDKIQHFQEQLIEAVEAQFQILEQVFEKNYLPFTRLPQLEEITTQRLESVKHIIWEASFERSKQAILSQSEGLKRQPISIIFNKYQAIAENLGKRLGKQLEVHTQGGEIEVPTNQLQDLFSAIIHLIRNSVEHGIENMEERVFLGKTLEGEINFHAIQKESTLILSFQDDGHGMSAEQIYQVCLTYQSNEELSAMSAEQITQVLLSAGASSGGASTASGLGLQTVYHAVQKLNGTMTLDTAKEKGSTFIITIPNIINT